MLTYTQGYRIEQVPGLREIRVEPDAGSDRGVHILLDAGECNRSYGIEELTELGEAIDTAVRLASDMALQIERNREV